MAANTSIFEVYAGAFGKWLVKWQSISGVLTAMRIHGCVFLFVLLAFNAAAQTPALSKVVQEFVRVHDTTVVLAHVRVVDGTGSAAVEDRNVTIEDGKIGAIEPGADIAGGPDKTVLSLRGYTVMPGIVGMHDHLFYIALPNFSSATHASGFPFDPPLLVPQMTFSAPRLYLAGGVTTMRTTGSVEPYADLNLKRDIDDGKLPGPHIDVTGPYLEGGTSYFIQMPHLTSPDDARKTVEYWVGQGVTSFKAYMNITRAELKAAIDAAHEHHLKVTGHLCSVTYKEAVELGIDDLEHGFFANTQLDSGKKEDVCSESAGGETLMRMQPGSAEATDLIQTLVSHHVAVTSTLPVFESMAGVGRPPLRQAVLDAMSPQARESFFLVREGARRRRAPNSETLWQHDLGLERAFVAAGGLLLSGPDPTGGGDVLPGFGDQRGIELLVEAGFTPVEAIQIATLNGAKYLGREKQIGSVATGKNADLIVVKGDPAKRISDIENVELVFKDGVGYDSQKLLNSVRGRYGEY